MHTLAIAVTNRCPLRCDFCCVPPGPGDLSDPIISGLVDQAISSRLFRSVGFTGGEPLLRPAIIAECGAKLSRAQIEWGVTTGLGWAKREDRASHVATSLASAGLKQINISFDPSHQSDRRTAVAEAFIKPLLETDARITLAVTTADEAPDKVFQAALDHITARFPSIIVNWHYIAPVGFAKGRDSSKRTIKLGNARCPLKKGLTLSVWPNGSVYPCCSTYVVNKSDALVYGSIFEDSLPQIISRIVKDPFYLAITSIGLLGLVGVTRDMDWSNVFDQVPQDACHMCSMIAEKPNLVANIRDKLLDMHTAVGV